MEESGKNYDKSEGGGLKDGRLERMKKNLYRRFGDDILNKKEKDFHLYEKEYDIPETWDNLDTETTMPKQKTSHIESRWPKRFLVFSALFFVIALIAAGAMFFLGGNTVSSKNIGVEISGPVSVAAGEELSLQISVENNNALPIEFTDLLVSYPAGTRGVDDVTKELPRFRMSLGTIDSGEVVHEVARSVLFGEENSQQKIFVTLEYRVDGSNAIFVKEAEYVVSISSAPIRVSVDTIKEVSINQEMTLEVTVASASEVTAKDLLLKIEYPFGFELTDASANPIFGENTWSLGDIPVGSKRTIQITGIMRGQNEEAKVFRVIAGARSLSDETAIGVAYTTLFQEVRLREPFLGTRISINGEDNENYVARSDENIRVVIDWENTLSSRITNGVIEVSLSGEALDRQSVSARDGIYDSIRNVVVWDRKSMPELANIESGKSGNVRFSFRPASFSSGKIISGPEVKMSVSVRGTRASESNVPEEVRTLSERRVRFISDVQLSARALHFSGPFVNRGTLPPQAEKETTYTIIWTVLNSSNQIDDVEVSAILPSYIQWLSSISPSGSKVSFDHTSGQVVWDIGSLSAGAGFTGAAKEVSFSVALVPSVNQIGTAPILIEDATLTGRDQFAGVSIETTARALGTRLSTDTAFSFGQEKVIPAIAE